LKVVLCFDVDGTLDVGDPRGPIDHRLLWHLATLDIVTCVVSDSWGKIPGDVLGKVKYVYGTRRGDKTPSLREILYNERRVSPFVVPFYVGDLESDRVMAERAGFIYVHPRVFRVWGMIS